MERFLPGQMFVLESWGKKSEHVEDVMKGGKVATVKFWYSDWGAKSRASWSVLWNLASSNEHYHNASQGRARLRVPLSDSENDCLLSWISQVQAKAFAPLLFANISLLQLLLFVCVCVRVCVHIGVCVCVCVIPPICVPVRVLRRRGRRRLQESCWVNKSEGKGHLEATRPTDCNYWPKATLMVSEIQRMWRHRLLSSALLCFCFFSLWS